MPCSWQDAWGAAAILDRAAGFRKASETAVDFAAPRLQPQMGAAQPEPLRVLLASAVVSVAHSLAPPRAGAATIGGLTLVPQEPRGAACLDGSAPGYWVDMVQEAKHGVWLKLGAAQ